MIVAAAQLTARAGDVAHNLDQHLAAARLAAKHGADLVAFPELSLTGYEPTLARQLALDVDAPSLDPLDRASANLKLTLAVGLPTVGSNKPYITQLFFRPDQGRIACSKQRLHSDEQPYFSGGKAPRCLTMADEVIAPAICFEALNADHAEAAAAAGATVYLACVAKPAAGIAAAETRFPAFARQHGFCVVMANATGLNDNFTSAGRSAAWGPNGQAIGQLEPDRAGLLLTNTRTHQTTVIHLD